MPKNHVNMKLWKLVIKDLREYEKQKDLPANLSNTVGLLLQKQRAASPELKAMLQKGGK